MKNPKPVLQELQDSTENNDVVYMEISVRIVEKHWNERKNEKYNKNPRILADHRAKVYREIM